MHDPARVRVVERAREPDENRSHVARMHPAIAQSREPGAESGPSYVLHHDVHEVIGFAEAVHRDDAVVVQARGDTRLTAKALALLFDSRELVTQHFDRDEAMQHDVA